MPHEAIVVQKDFSLYLHRAYLEDKQLVTLRYAKRGKT